MRRHTLLPALFFGAFTMAGCASGMQANYDLGLASVDQPAQLGDRYGDVERQVVGDSVKYVYSDSLLEVTWIPTPLRVGFILENRTEHSMKIIWDEAAFVAPNGQTSRVMHKGIRLINRNESQPPTVIAAGSKLVDMVAPTDYVDEPSGNDGWRQEAFLDPYRLTPLEAKNDDTVEEFRHGVLGNQGSEFRILLPLEIEGEVNEYTFTFEVRDASVPTQ